VFLDKWFACVKNMGWFKELLLAYPLSKFLDCSIRIELLA
jgi:hypothetical protein